MKKNFGFTSLSTLLEKYIKKKGLQPGIIGANSVEVAREFFKIRFPPEAVERISPVSCQAGVLKISCTSASAAAHVQRFSSELIAYINKNMHSSVVKSVQVYTA